MLSRAADRAGCLTRRHSPGLQTPCASVPSGPYAGGCRQPIHVLPRDRGIRDAEEARRGGQLSSGKAGHLRSMRISGPVDRRSGWWPMLRRLPASQTAKATADADAEDRPVHPDDRASDRGRSLPDSLDFGRERPNWRSRLAPCAGLAGGFELGRSSVDRLAPIVFFPRDRRKRLLSRWSDDRDTEHNRSAVIHEGSASGCPLVLHGQLVPAIIKELELPVHLGVLRLGIFGALGVVGLAGSDKLGRSLLPFGLDRPHGALDTGQR